MQLATTVAEIAKQHPLMRTTWSENCYSAHLNHTTVLSQNLQLLGKLRIHLFYAMQMETNKQKEEAGFLISLYIEQLSLHVHT